MNLHDGCWWDHAGTPADEQDIEIRLTADGDQTVLVWEERGMR